MDQHGIEVTTSMVFGALCRVHRIAGCQPVSMDDLITYLRQNGYGGSWMGTLEALVEQAIHRLIAGRRVISPRPGYYVPVSSLPQSPPEPFPTLWRPRIVFPDLRLRQPRPWYPPTSLPFPDSPKPWPWQSPSTMNVGEPIYSPRIPSLSTTPSTFPGNIEDEPDEPQTPRLPPSSFPPTVDAPESARPTSDPDSSSGTTGSGSTNSTLTTGSSTDTTTASDQMPRLLRRVTVSPTDFERFLRESQSEPKDEGGQGKTGGGLGDDR